MFRFGVRAALVGLAGLLAVGCKGSAAPGALGAGGLGGASPNDGGGADQSTGAGGTGDDFEAGRDGAGGLAAGSGGRGGAGGTGMAGSTAGGGGTAPGTGGTGLLSIAATLDGLRLDAACGVVGVETCTYGNLPDDGQPYTAMTSATIGGTSGTPYSVTLHIAASPARRA